MIAVGIAETEEFILINQSGTEIQVDAVLSKRFLIPESATVALT